MMTLLRRLVPGMGPSTAADGELRVVADDHPKDAFFATPLSVASLTTAVEELDHPGDDRQVRVSFAATVRDGEGKRCPEMAVYARIAGPERTATGMGHTSLLGKVTFRMSGPPGTYTCTIRDVAGGGLGLDEDASTLQASIDATASDTAA